MRFVLAATACLTVLESPSFADEKVLQSLDGAITFRGEFGLANLRAGEFVYEGKTKVSELKWKSQGVQTFTGGADISLPHDLALSIEATVGFNGNGHMVDYDWFNPNRNWSHRSIHPDTRLNHYFTGDIELGRTVFEQDGTRFGLGAGLHYSDVKWTAWGGSYVYSDTGWRRDRGKFPKGEKGISYRQSWPVPYIAGNVSHVSGDWSFAGALKAGITAGGQGTDDHWMRDLRFVDHFDARPMLAFDGSVAYALRENVSLSFSGGIEHMFKARADTTMIDRISGNRDRFRNGAASDFTAITLRLGVNGRF